MTSEALYPIAPRALLRLLRLASPALPVGAYSYSQGLEWAVECGTVHDAASARTWIEDVLRFSMARFEGPLWWRFYHAWRAADHDAARLWNDRFLASRETAELHAETVQMGYSLRRLLADLGEFSAPDLAPLQAIEHPSYPAVAAFAAAAWRIPPAAALLAYAWSWAENQVMAAMKSVPLGQGAGQGLLAALGPALEEATAAASVTEDDALSNFAPGLALASSLHEAQYSRLFRS